MGTHSEPSTERLFQFLLGLGEVYVARGHASGRVGRVHPRTQQLKVHNLILVTSQRSTRRLKRFSANEASMEQQGK